MRIKLRSATAVTLGLVSALIIAVAGSPAAAELVAGASASSSAHAAKKKAAHKKTAHKKKAHKKKAHKKKAHKKKAPQEEERTSFPHSRSHRKGSDRGDQRGNRNSRRRPLSRRKPEFLSRPATGSPPTAVPRAIITPSWKKSDVERLAPQSRLDDAARRQLHRGEVLSRGYPDRVRRCPLLPHGHRRRLRCLREAPGRFSGSTRANCQRLANPCCGWDNRGVASAKASSSPRIAQWPEALNQKTGELVWKTELGEAERRLSRVTAHPLYYDGMVFIGPVGSEYGIRGFMAAYSAKTGELLWKHYNVPAPGEYGHNTWPTGTGCVECNGEWEHGGASVWHAPSVDPKAGLIYYSTANAYPDYYGGERPGENLWTASMLALNYKTGKMAWGYQQVHHDIWDFDSANPTVRHRRRSQRQDGSKVSPRPTRTVGYVLRKRGDGRTGLPGQGGTDSAGSGRADVPDRADSHFAERS